MQVKQYFKLKENIPSRLYIGLGLFSFGALFLLWCILTYGVCSALFLPSQRTSLAVWLMVTEMNLFSDIVASVYRVSVGFLCTPSSAYPQGS